MGKLMPQIEWGIPTLLEAPGPEEAAALCRELGFHFVELNMNLPQYQRWDIPRLQKAAKDNNIYYTIHLDENLDVCDFNPRVAKAYLDTMLETIEAAKVLGVPILNMHMQLGVYFTLPEEKVYLYASHPDHYRAQWARTVSCCEQAAVGSNITICLENTNGFLQPFLLEGLDLLLQSPLFGLTYDIGHDHGVGEVDKPFMLEHQDRLRHFHIHDALGKKNHMQLGTGEMDIPWYLALAAKNHCRAVLEVKTVQALRDSVDWLKNQGLFSTK